MLNSYDILLRLLLAALLGSVIGLDRQRLNWAAGLHTHMLVCVGAALFMMVSTFGFGDVLQVPYVTLDPSRIAAQVVSGIGFLGAGSILVRSRPVDGSRRGPGRRWGHVLGRRLRNQPHPADSNGYQALGKPSGHPAERT